MKQLSPSVFRRGFSFIYSLVVCSAEDIICRDLVKICENKKMFHRNRLEAAFIAGIDRLTGVEELGDLCLVHIHIFAQVSQPLKVHKYHLRDL